MSAFKYVTCACQPAVGEGLLPEHSVSVKGTRSETTQVNAHMATVDHDRQGQAAHRWYKLHTVVEFASGLKGTNKRQRFSS